jgi:hypothetical protein
MHNLHTALLLEKDALHIHFVESDPTLCAYSLHALCVHPESYSGSFSNAEQYQQNKIGSPAFSENHQSILPQQKQTM